MQVKILPIADRHHDFANKFAVQLRNSFIRAEVDLRAEALSKKIAEAHAQKVNYLVVIGDKEMSENSLSVQARGSKTKAVIKVEDFIADAAEKIRRRAL